MLPCGENTVDGGRSFHLTDDTVHRQVKRLSTQAESTPKSRKGIGFAKAQRFSKSYFLKINEIRFTKF